MTSHVFARPPTLSWFASVVVPMTYLYIPSFIEICSGVSESSQAAKICPFLYCFGYFLLEQLVFPYKARQHQQQCRSNNVECYKSNDSFHKVDIHVCCFDKVERCYDTVAGVGGAYAMTLDNYFTRCGPFSPMSTLHVRNGDQCSTPKRDWRPFLAQLLRRDRATVTCKECIRRCSQMRPVCCPRGPKLIQEVIVCEAPCCLGLHEMRTSSMPHMGEFIWCENSEVWTLPFCPIWMHLCVLCKLVEA